MPLRPRAGLRGGRDQGGLRRGQHLGAAEGSVGLSTVGKLHLVGAGLPWLLVPVCREARCKGLRHRRQARPQAGGVCRRDVSKAGVLEAQFVSMMHGRHGAVSVRLAGAQDDMHNAREPRNSNMQGRRRVYTLDPACA